jgi:hypothetical protein
LLHFRSQLVDRVERFGVVLVSEGRLKIHKE